MLMLVVFVLCKAIAGDTGVVCIVSRRPHGAHCVYHSIDYGLMIVVVRNHHRRTQNAERNTHTKMDSTNTQNTQNTHDAYAGPHFDMICVGVGGGPDEGNLSSYIFKSHHQPWDDGCVAIDAGSGVGALSRAIRSDISIVDDLREALPGDEYEGASSKADSNDTAHKKVTADTRHDTDSYRLASRIYTSITAYLITHPHLDHLAGLVINSSMKFGACKRLVGFEKTLKGIEVAFGGLLWPALASWASCGGLVERLQYMQIEPFAQFDVPGYVHDAGSGSVSGTPSHTANHTFSCTPFPISHGTVGLVADARTRAAVQVEKDPNEVYDSIAYFVEKHSDSAHKWQKSFSFLFWGDVEPDAISTLPRNKPVWAEAARRFVLDELRWVWIECSYTNARPNHLLFGHLKPDLLVDELQTLAIIVERFRRMGVEQLRSVNTSEFSVGGGSGSGSDQGYANADEDITAAQHNHTHSPIDNALDTPSHPLSHQASQAVNKALFGGLNHASRTGYNEGFGVHRHTTSRPLQGLTIAITHVKEDPMLGCDVVGERILSELESNPATKNLGTQTGGEGEVLEEID
ncbi:hypothetical protein E3P84_03650 [Wallemia ichthyophaga]|nr:hypothetical protein E3P84_03650 [Wallemia ichthyophaga]TIB39187.1 hypothetical protein E3P83_03622 [Wallemia ichthyophaga]